ncbi:MAG: phosphoribosyl-AMP cyclohydrolase [Arenicellales bacterium WSBS_2016_MAG_OTU3]
MDSSKNWLDKINWPDSGLLPAIAQDANDGTLLMQAWVNRDALAISVDEGRAVYWSRARQKLWRKGEESGNVQILKELRLDCDNDSILFLVEQVGGIACHTGRRRCYFQKLENGEWINSEVPVQSQDELYGKTK